METVKGTMIHYGKRAKIAYCTTDGEKLKRKLLGLCEEYPDDYKVLERDDVRGSITFVIPKKSVSIRAPGKPRVISDEKREELRVGMKKVLEAKKSK